MKYLEAVRILKCKVPYNLKKFIYIDNNCCYICIYVYKLLSKIILIFIPGEIQNNNFALSLKIYFDMKVNSIILWSV